MDDNEKPRWEKLPNRAQKRAARFAPNAQAPSPTGTIMESRQSKSFMRRKTDKLWAKVQWMFPLSSTPHRHGLFYFLFGIPFGLFIFGAEMTGNYTVVRWAFVGTWITAVLTSWLSLVVLARFARKFWTATLALILGVALIYCYKYLCPTVTIKPARVVFGSISADPNGVSQTYRFRIQNKTDDDVYGVSFKLRVKSNTLSLDDFKLEIPKSSQVPLDENSSVGSKFADISGMNCTDSKSRPVLWMTIAHLGPHDSREITLTRINPAAESIPPSGTVPPRISMPQAKNGVDVDAELIGFTDDSTVLDRPGFLGNPTVLDEALKCSAIIKYVLK